MEKERRGEVKVALVSWDMVGREGSNWVLTVGLFETV